MKIKIFILGLIIFQFATHASSGEPVQKGKKYSDLCLEKMALMESSTRTFVDCEDTSFGKALTADYQAKNKGALTQGKVKHSKKTSPKKMRSRVQPKADEDQNADRFISHAEEVLNPQGLSLLQKFAEEVRESMPNDRELSNYVSGKLFNDNRPVYSAENFVGSCHIWSAWSLDPEVLAMMSKVNEGLFCNGIPFTRGELKELITAVYPEPQEDITNRTLKGYYDPNTSSPKYSVPPKDIETANLALAGLGEFGAESEFKPENILQMAREAKAAGNTLIMDLNPGTNEVWNQPIEAVVDVFYTDRDPERYTQNQYKYLNGKDLVAKTVPGKAIVDAILLAEADLKAQALEGGSQGSDCLFGLRKLTGIKKFSAGSQSLMDQVDELKAIQRELLNRKNARSDLGINSETKKVVKHRIFIQYGQEGRFAQNTEEPPGMRELDYITVGDRSFWSPPTRRLTQVCDNKGRLIEDSDLLSRRVNDSGYRFTASNAGLDNECQKLKAGEKGRKIAVGAFPPKIFKTFHLDKRKERLSKNRDESTRLKIKAYEHLKKMISECGSGGNHNFLKAANFVKHLTEVLSTNPDLESGEIKKLATEYRSVKDFLDLKSVKKTLEETYPSSSNDYTNERSKVIKELLSAINSNSADSP